MKTHCHNFHIATNTTSTFMERRTNYNQGSFNGKPYQGNKRPQGAYNQFGNSGGNTNFNGDRDGAPYKKQKFGGGDNNGGFNPEQNQGGGQNRYGGNQRDFKENNFRGGNRDYNNNRGDRDYNKPRDGGNRDGGFDNRRRFGGDQTNTGNNFGGGGQSFGNRPSGSLMSCNRPDESKVQKVQFYTNQFRMKIGQNAPQFYQYPLNLFPGEAEDLEDDGNYKFTPVEVSKVVEKEKARIELLTGKFIYSGYNLWTTQRLEESFIITSKLMGTKVTLKIDHTGEYTVNSSDAENPNRQDCQAMGQILNVIVKQAMSETGLLQFGKRPRFFDSSAPIYVKEHDMQIWGGFQATASKYMSGCNLCIDSCARFMSTKSVMDKCHETFDEMLQQFNGDAQRAAAPYKDQVRKLLIGTSVIANYGTKRTYIIQDINFDKGPVQTLFNLKDGQSISVAKYFYKTYNLKVSDKRQPMLVVSFGGRQVSLPSEFCLVDGVPDAIRNNSRAMRSLLNEVKQNPKEKLDAIVGMVKNLFKMKKWAEFDIQLDSTPQIQESRKLAAPELIHKEGDDKHLYANENLLKKMPVFSCDTMNKHELLLVFDKYSRQEADSCNQNLMKCQGQMNMKCNGFSMLQLPDSRGNWNKVSEAIDSYLDDPRRNGSGKPVFATIITNNRSDYSRFKGIFTRKSIMS